MVEFWAVISLILGFILRIGIPILLTILIGNGLRKLDKKWQEDGRKIMLKDLTSAERLIETMNCWEFYECSDSKRDDCIVEGHVNETNLQFQQSIVGEHAENLICKYRQFIDDPNTSIAKNTVHD